MLRVYCRSVLVNYLETCQTQSPQKTLDKTPNIVPEYMASLRRAARCRRGPQKCRAAWYDNSAASAAARRNSEPRRAAAFDSLEIPSYQIDDIMSH